MQEVAQGMALTEELSMFYFKHPYQKAHNSRGSKIPPPFVDSGYLQSHTDKNRLMHVNTKAL